MTHQFDLNKPAHHIANDVMRQLETLAHESGVEIAFGVKAHNVIARLVQQYQDKLTEARADKLNNDNTLAEVEDARQKDTNAAKLCTMFDLARFPDVEDVYMSTAYCAYVTFAKLLLQSQIQFADAALNLDIERSDPRLRNRYRVTFKSPDREEA